MARRGPKGYGEELKIKQRYADLSDKAFAFLSECLDGDEKADKKWAVEQLSKGLVKMIPQDVTSKGEKLNLGFDGQFKRLSGTTPETKGDSSVAS